MISNRTIVAEAPKVKTDDLWLSAHIVGPAHETYLFPQWLVQARLSKAKSLLDADIVFFAGGPDVSPDLYGETKHHSTCFSPALDKEYMAAYAECYENGIPMVGICRGAQFLHVMQPGGKLYQDVDGHMGDHAIWDCFEQVTIPASSVHHQMVMDNTANGMKILATASGKSTRRAINQTTTETGKVADIEAYFYRDSVCLGIQGHPEYRGYPEFSDWSFKQIQKYFCENPDLAYVEKNLRLKPELLAERKAKVL
jgi:putative glutamine amidotransferase